MLAIQLSENGVVARTGRKTFAVAQLLGSRLLRHAFIAKTAKSSKQMQAVQRHHDPGRMKATRDSLKTEVTCDNQCRLKRGKKQLPSQALGGYSAGLMRCCLSKEWHRDWGRGWRSKGKSEVPPSLLGQSLPPPWALLASSQPAGRFLS